ncbi:hypothetical protein B0H16DRAFT_1838030 [Mycena metata]|uniref:Uncharacterized protein n=1 Tax=Mycena metata TaxID=1033252 RepID=A0AAD7NXG3_9AGAR|nr:hypothetical protein B0H16DRAFT_1838030 [Mycena metata]
MTSGQKANKTAVLQLIDNFYEYRDQRVDEIWDSQSPENRMTKEWIRKQMTSSAYAGASRAPNYWNGYVRKCNRSSRRTILIARRMEEAGCDAFKDFVSDSEKKDLREEMAEEQKKHVGVRKTNLANIGDVSRNCKKIRVMLEGLRERCGVLSLAFIARGNIKDAARAECLYTGRAADFLTDVFKISVVEFLWRYEAYCSMRDDKLITGRKDVKMFYKHYDYGIRYLLGVELVGLLEDAKAPINPTKISTLARLQSTLDALVTGKMHWRKMMAAQLSKHIAAMDEASACRLRNAKTSQGALPAKSKETVDLSKDEGEEDVEDEGGDAARDKGKEDVEDKGKDAVSDAGEDDNDDDDDKNEEEEEEEAPAAKKTAAANAGKVLAGPPKIKRVRKASSPRPAAKTKGAAKAKPAAAKAAKAKPIAAKTKPTAPKVKPATPKATAGPPQPRPKPRPVVKTPAIEVPTPVAEKENTTPAMNELTGVFDVNTGETQLGKRKRPAEDEGGGRELVDPAADDVLVTRQGRRTESAAAWARREVVLVQLVIEIEITYSEAVRQGSGQGERFKQNVKRKNRKKKINKVDVGGRDGGRGRRGDVREWRCDVWDMLLMGDRAVTTAAAKGDEDGGEDGGVQYLCITEIAIRCAWAHIFCFAACIELPTLLLGLATLLPPPLQHPLRPHLPPHAHPPPPRPPPLLRRHPCDARPRGDTGARVPAACDVVCGVCEGVCERFRARAVKAAKTPAVVEVKHRHPLAPDVYPDARSLARHSTLTPTAVPQQWGSVTLRLRRLRARVDGWASSYCYPSSSPFYYAYSPLSLSLSLTSQGDPPGWFPPSSHLRLGLAWTHRLLSRALRHSNNVWRPQRSILRAVRPRVMVRRMSTSLVRALREVPWAVVMGMGMPSPPTSTSHDGEQIAGVEGEVEVS